MKRYSAASARQHLSEVLDEAESGQPVVIERRGVQFDVVARPKKKTRKIRHRKLFDWVDPVLLSGQWTWVWTKRGLEFRARK